MAPPTYADLGKAARDVINKGYHFGIFNLDVKTHTLDGVDISSGGTHTFENGKLSGKLETKYKVPEYGLIFTEKWHTSNNLTTEVSCQDKLAPGVKVGLEGTLNPDTGKKSGVFKAQYKSKNATLDTDLNGGDDANLLINGALVLAYKGWLGGCQMAYDTVEGALNKNNFTLGYCAGDFQVHANVDNGESFGGTIYQRVSNRLEAGIQLTWKAGGESNTHFGIGARYLLDPCTALRAKVNNGSQVGLSFEHKLRDGVSLTLSTLINGKEFNAGGHQIGIGLELEP